MTNKVTLISSAVDKAFSDRISESRRLLQNPYAYLSDTGTYEALVPLVEANPMSEAITESRKLLQNQYAYLNDKGGFSAAQRLQAEATIQDGAFPKLKSKANNHYATVLGGFKKTSRYSDEELEELAVALQRMIWEDREQIWLDASPENPIDTLDPAVALSLLGYEYDLETTLGQYFHDGRQVEVAGVINNSSVRISQQFPRDVRNFTAAHELGHALLHDVPRLGLHRDRPIDGTSLSRDDTEREADKFSSYYLMPAKLLRKYFYQYFGTENFLLTDDTAFALARGTALKLDVNCRNRRELSRVLASAESYNGVRFQSLANVFRVSVEAMAIRLEELKLLAV